LMAITGFNGSKTYNSKKGFWPFFFGLQFDNFHTTNQHL